MKEHYSLSVSKKINFDALEFIECCSLSLPEWKMATKWLVVCVWCLVESKLSTGLVSPLSAWNEISINKTDKT